MGSRSSSCTASAAMPPAGCRSSKRSPRAIARSPGTCRAVGLRAAAHHQRSPPSPKRSGVFSSSWASSVRIWSATRWAAWWRRNSRPPFQDRVRSLVLVATSAAFGRADGGWQRDFLARRLGPLDRGRTMADLAPDVVAGLIGDAPDAGGVAPGDPQHGERARSDLSRGAALSAHLRSARRLGAAGGAGAASFFFFFFFFFFFMERMAARMLRAEFLVLPGAGHLMNLEQPGRFNRALAEFLREPAKVKWARCGSYGLGGRSSGAPRT